MYKVIINIVYDSYYKIIGNNIKKYSTINCLYKDGIE